MPLSVTVDVPPRDREILESWLRAPSLRAGLAQRARIVLLAADGVPVKDIVERVGVSKPTVIGWKKRYAAEGLGGLQDRPKPGRRPVIDEVAVVLATLEPPPERLGVTHWSSRLLGAELGISHVWVGKIWRRWGLQPWRMETFKFSTDPELEAKVRDVVGLYLNPPDKAVVLCVDEKSQVQALDRTAPILPIMPGIPSYSTTVDPVKGHRLRDTSESSTTKEYTMSLLTYPPIRYNGKTGRVNARFRPAASAPDLVSGDADAGVTGAGQGQRTHYLATGASTGGEFGLYRIDMPPRGRGPTTHFHRTISESFYILSGTVRLFDGENWIDASPGDFLYVPVSGRHAFHNGSDEPASLLLLFSPGAPREGYFEGLSELANISDEEREEFFHYHDTYWISE